MTAPVSAVNVQIPGSATAPIVADFIAHALRVAYVHRRDIQSLREKDWQVPGVYLLMTADGSGLVYVGKSIELRGRLLTHHRDPRLNWTRAMVCQRDTTHGFTSADIGYLEGRLAAELRAISGITVQEGREDLDVTSPPHVRIALDELLSSILAAVRLAGLDTYKDADLPEEEGPADAVSPLPGRSFASTIGLADLIGSGLIDAGAELFLSQGGTTARATVSSQGDIIVDGVAYRSPSRAAIVAINALRESAEHVKASNGWTVWRVGGTNGPTLDALRRLLDDPIPGDELSATADIS